MLLDSPSTSSLFNLFLEHSRLHSIDFKIDHVSDWSLPPSSLAARETSDRWRHADIAALSTFVEEMSQLLIDHRRSLPALVSFALHCEASLSLSVACPNLRSLTLHGTALELEYPRPSVRYLDLDLLTPEEALRVISRCPDIQFLVVMQLINHIALGQDPPLPLPQI